MASVAAARQMIQVDRHLTWRCRGPQRMRKTSLREIAEGCLQTSFAAPVSMEQMLLDKSCKI